MNNTTAIIGGIAAVIIIGGLIIYSTGNTTPPSINVPSTLAGSTNTSPTTTSGETQTPEAPIVLTSAKAYPTDTTVVLSGSVTPNGAFTSYWYEFGATESLGNKTSNQTIGSGYTTIPAPAYITGFSKDTSYFFRLVALNQFGTVTGSKYSFQTTHGVPSPVGSIPNVKTLTADGISRNTANLNGEVTPNKVGTMHWFEYGQTANLGNTTALVSVGDGSTKVPASVSFSDLNPATTYYFRLNAQNQFGTVNGTILNFKTLGPVTVSNAPSATTRAAGTIGTTTATLHGTIAPNSAETTYWFEYSTNSLFKSSLLTTTDKKVVGAAMSPVTVEVLVDISSLKGNTNYYFRVVAENPRGLVRGERQTFRTK
ncbi:MAG: hypothetical protein Q7S11_01080 [bacterium]|nr:hypothetical protein [bacterium]